MPKLRFRRRKSEKLKYIFAGVVLLILALVVLFSVTQLKIVREFFGRAGGEPANLKVDTLGVIGPMPRPWRNLAQGGEDHAWRIQPIQSQVNALHPRYIRLDHIYDFYDIVQGSPGNLTFDFSKLDLVLDDISATDAKPYIALSYMPPAISSGDITDAPHNWADWQVIVQKTIEHISGTRKTPDVYYEVWNEPDLFGGWKYYGDKNYLTMYSYAAYGAANARGTLPFKLGGPATTALYKNWFNALAQHVVDNNLRFDFFSWHHYSYDLDAYKKDMLEVREWIRDFPMLEPTLEFHITEWGHDSENNAGYDSGFSAAHTVAGAIEMVGVVENAFVFEIQDGKGPEGQASWGRWGLLQHNDFGSKAKPRYWGLRMLDRIGEQRLQLLGKGSWVKALAARDDDGNTEVIISNYDMKGRHAETVPLTFENITPGTYTISKEFLSGQKTSEEVATTSAILQTFIPMNANNVAFVELIPSN